MNEDIKREWVADLRSGEIHKTKSQLRRGNRMCVAGVLCNIHAKHHPDIAVKQTSKSKYMGEREIIPVEVANWAGISQAPKLTFDGRLHKIYELNDDKGLTFKQLADLIEKQL